MSPLKIATDLPLRPELLAKLQDAVYPHQVTPAAKPLSSVLASGAANPLVKEADIVFGQPSVEDIQQATRLKWIAISSAGYTRYDTPEFKTWVQTRGIQVTNSSHVFAEPCAEHVFAFLLAQARQLPRALSLRCANTAPEWAGLRERSFCLEGQRVLILGYGTIGKRLIELLAPLRMPVEAFRRSPRPESGVSFVGPGELEEALGRADHVINILPDSPETRSFMNHHRFGLMKPGASFYNIGRGTTVDQEALATFLKSGHLASAWLDVTEPEPLPEGHPLWTIPECHITPHTAGGHGDEYGTLVNHFLRNFAAFLKNQPLQDRIY